mgnify:CR=1 FL=1|jgi:glucose-6-phosphate isomerase
MISFDFRNSGVDLEAVADRIPGYLEKIHARNQGFYSAIDEISVEEIEAFAAAADYDDVVVLGIGGSALGAFCLDRVLGSNGPNLWVVDNVDPAFIASIEAKINLERTLFLVISKSGQTIETRAQYSYFKNCVEEAGLNAEDHFVFISGADTGLNPKFVIPENVGGRFSVLTPVGLVPAALMGLDIRALLKGAKTMRDSFLNKSFEENLPFQLAAVQFLAAKPNVVMMPYCQRLSAFVEWWRQLLAESTGKEGKGLTPIEALGVTDQHSQNQLYNEGPNDKFLMMIKVEDLGIDLPTGMDELSFTQLLHTEMEGTVQSFTENGRPNMTIKIERLNEETLGALFMLFEAMTAFLGEFFEINAFDQPGVELSKQITLKLLSQ